MARFQASGFSGTTMPASASATTPVVGGLAFAFAASATAGAKVRRATLGVLAGSGAPTSQNLVLGVARFTAAPTGGSAAATSGKMDPNSAAGTCTLTPMGLLGTAGTTFAAGTFGPCQWQIPINTQAGGDLPWELIEEWVVPVGTANGLGFFNLLNALPASHQYSLALEWEE